MSACGARRSGAVPASWREPARVVRRRGERSASIIARSAGTVLVLGALLLAGCRAGALGHGRNLTTPPPAGPPVESFKLPPLTQRTLPNGMTLLVAEYHELPIVVFNLLLRAGAALDQPGKAGLASLTADTIQEGTKRRSAEELARDIEFLGGSINTDASYDFAGVSGEFLRKDLDEGFALFAEVALEPAFRPADFRRAQRLTLANLVAARENPSTIADHCFQAFLYGTHPYGHPTDGTESTVQRLTDADVRDFYRAHWGPEHSVLVVVGDASADELAARAARLFGDWRPAAMSPPALAAPARIHGRHLLLVDKPDATQAHIRVGNVAIARTDSAYIPAVVTSTILGGGFGSRLIDELRVKRSLTYGAWSYFAAHLAPGEFRAGTFTKVPTIGQTLTLTLDVLREFVTAGPTPAEVSRAQSLIGGQYPLQLETPSALAGKLADLTEYGLPVTEIEAYPGRILAVGPQDVREIANRYIPTDDAAIVVVGPAATIAPQLGAFGDYAHATPASCTEPGAPTAAR